MSKATKSPCSQPKILKPGIIVSLLYNSATCNYDLWLAKLKDIASNEYETIIPQEAVTAGEFYNYYLQGMDVHEAISTHIGQPFNHGSKYY